MDFSGWEKLSLVDYDDNITTTLFMAGCNMRCPFCHNMDLVINPQNAPTIPWEEIYDYLKKRQGVLDAVCVSGGEPTLMPDLLEKLSLIKELGYKVKLDSNGSNPDKLAEAISKGLVDYVAMDIKNSPERYGETIGVPSFNLAPIKASVELLKNNKVAYEFRTTIMDEFHDETAMKSIGEWIAGAPRYFLQLYIDSDHCIVGGFHAVSEEKAKRFLEIVKPYVGEAKLRSY
ncbi:MAG: anaerobic ribonucleoside-triphosphate reductase activating protein [Bacillota bacterium]|nr:anaerobic ribonucleoside-triphosphate reductase activating protein [Bacillota bacterium]